MSEALTALAGLDAPAAYIGIADAGPLGQITLRADLSDGAVAAALQGVLGAVPGVLQVAADGARRTVWMAPDELLVLAPPADRDGLIAALAEALASRHAMVLDVSDARAVVRLTGPGVGEVLAKGAPCDCSDPAFPPGTARRSHMGGLAVGIWRLEPEVWEVVCFRSFAHHLWAWLHKAAAPGSEIG